MNLQNIKYAQCLLDRGEAILLVDIDTETIPQTDQEGRRQYYCLRGYHIFSVDENGKSVLREEERNA